LLRALIEHAQIAPNRRALCLWIFDYLSQRVPFDSATYFPIGIAGDEPVTSFEDESEQTRRLTMYLQHQDRYRADFRKAAAEIKRIGGYIDTEVYSAEERSRLRFFREIVQPSGITSRLTAMVALRGVVIGILTLNRKGGRPFRDRELQRVLTFVTPIALGQGAFDLVQARGTQVSAVQAGTTSLRGVARFEADAQWSVGLPQYLPVMLRGLPTEALTAGDLDFERLWAGLGARERQVSAYVSCGYRNGEIATMLGTSANTVKNQLKRIFTKLGVGNRTELAIFFQRLGRRRLDGELAPRTPGPAETAGGRSPARRRRRS
jgi:DNA-binding CsgD family transcriptional regulator